MSSICSFLSSGLSSYQVNSDNLLNHSSGYFPILLAMYCRTTYNDTSAWLVNAAACFIAVYSCSRDMAIHSYKTHSRIRLVVAFHLTGDHSWRCCTQKAVRHWLATTVTIKNGHQTQKEDFYSKKQKCKLLKHYLILDMWMNFSYSLVRGSACMIVKTVFLMF
jgi:hypothetical protein